MADGVDVINIREEEIAIVIMDYLKRKKFLRTLSEFERESGVNLEIYGEEIGYIRRLLLDGQWEDIESILSPLHSEGDVDVDSIRFMIRRQKFLELVHSQALSDAVMELVENLKPLEDKCSPDEFSRLCYCISMSNLSKHPYFKHWSPHKGRLATFARIQPMLEVLYKSVHHGQNLENLPNPSRMEPQRLVTLLRQAIVYQISKAHGTKGSPQPLGKEVSLSIFEDFQIPGSEGKLGTESSIGKKVHPDSQPQMFEEEGRIVLGSIPSSIALHPTEEYVCIGTKKGDVEIIKTSKKRTMSGYSSKVNHIHHLSVHSDSIWALQWCSKNPRLLATASQDYNVRINFLPSNLTTDRFSSASSVIVGSHDACVTCVSFRPKKSNVISAAADGKICVWECAHAVTLGLNQKADNIELNDSCIQQFRHSDVVTCMSLSTDGTLLTSSSLDKTVKLWDFRCRGESLSIESKSAMYTVAVSPDCKKLVYGGGSFLQIFDLRKNAVTQNLNILPKKALWSPTGDRLFVAKGSGIEFLDAKSGTLIARHDIPGLIATGLRWQPSGARVISACEKKVVRKWSFRME